MSGNQLQAMMEEGLKTGDMFPFVYMADRRRNSKLGGCMSLIAIIVGLLLVISGLIQITSGDFVITVTEVPSENQYEINMPSSFGVTLYSNKPGATEGYNRTWYNARYATISMRYCVVTNQGVPDCVPVALQTCALDVERQTNLDQAIYGHCNAEPVSKVLTGSYFSGDFRFYQISVAACSDSTSLPENVTCATEDEFNALDLTAGVYIQYEQSPGVLQYQSSVEQLDYGFDKRTHAVFSHATAKYPTLGLSFLGYTDHADEIFTTFSHLDRNWQKSSKNVFTLFFRIDNQQHVIQEYYRYSFNQLFSDLGGYVAGAQVLGIVILMAWHGSHFTEEFEVLLGKPNARLLLQKYAYRERRDFAKERGMKEADVDIDDILEKALERAEKHVKEADMIAVRHFARHVKGVHHEASLKNAMHLVRRSIQESRQPTSGSSIVKIRPTLPELNDEEVLETVAIRAFSHEPVLSPRGEEAKIKSF